MSKKPVALIIMDGFGYNPDSYGNAIMAANTPNLDKYLAEQPNTIIGASGLCVGLPDGQMGNSEVGHTNIGAGRIVYQMLVKISKSIEDGDFFQNPALVNSMENAKKNNSALHVMGLLSPGGVHSHMTHLYGIAEMAKKFGLEKVYVHAFLDGRDVPPSSAAEYMQEAVDKLNEIGVGKIATIAGRFYAMDRDNAWDRVEKAYSALVYGEGVQESDPVQAIKNSYANEVTDEFMLPTVVDKNGMIKPNDSVIFMNFRPDRARQITRSFVDPDFTGFERKNGFFPVHFVCMAQYDATMPNVEVAFPPEELTMTLGEYLAKCGKTQLRIAETQKYAHVTFFFNGGEEKQFEGEDRILIKSPDVETFDMKPEMSAYEVTDAVLEAIESDKYDVIILNYANCDMVGHTGIFDAAVQAVEAVDTCVGKMVDAILAKGGVALITADHGNADKMYEADGSPFTAHTTNPVPFIVVGAGQKQLRTEGGVLADLSPTILKLMELPQPKEMTGQSLILD
ncbi:MAG: 2,3-bisphosphoglycerate-independent phosphoglycerate mutase [Oscillospiraceae bacterium]|nr:2,3-bisphosphoglycerate-independent phosphoglycerate mutase [Oscillospiraceae bacterium]